MSEYGWSWSIMFVWPAWHLLSPYLTLLNVTGCINRQPHRGGKITAVHRGPHWRPWFHFSTYIIFFVLLFSFIFPPLTITFLCPTLDKVKVYGHKFSLGYFKRNIYCMYVRIYICLHAQIYPHIIFFMWMIETNKNMSYVLFGWTIWMI